MSHHIIEAGLTHENEIRDKKMSFQKQNDRSVEGVDNNTEVRELQV
jgi:hypothetical protein